MQKGIFTILILFILSFPVFSQMTYDEMVTDFELFTEGVATTLPFNSVLGLNWSDAYIGNFPHFGAGVTVGIAFMPYGSLEETLAGLGVNLDTIPNEDIRNMLSGLGFPFPTVALEGRIGGFILPFDIGGKIGYIPADFEIPFLEGMVIDYLLIGADVRFRLLKGSLIIPTISAGGGFTYQAGSIDMPDMLGETKQITELAGGHIVSLEDPDLNFNWKTFVIDTKAQASWNLFLVTPYVGVGASYAPYAEAGGGMKSELLFDGEPITDDDIAMVDQFYDDPPDLDDAQILVYASTPAAWSVRAFGGLSLNLAIFRLDLLGLYNFASGGWGGSLNIRVQL